jgi:hypothetical protein
METFCKIQGSMERKKYKREREENTNSDKKYEGQRMKSMSRNEAVENKRDHE